MIHGLDPIDMARRCREQAEITEDAVLAEYLRQLAHDYDEAAQKNRSRNCADK